VIWEVAVGIRLTRYPRTDPDGRISHIRLSTQVVTCRRREGYRYDAGAEFGSSGPYIYDAAVRLCSLTKCLPVYQFLPAKNGTPNPATTTSGQGTTPLRWADSSAQTGRPKLSLCRTPNLTIRRRSISILTWGTIRWFESMRMDRLRRALAAAKVRRRAVRQSKRQTRELINRFTPLSKMLKTTRLAGGPDLRSEKVGSPQKMGCPRSRF